MTQAIIQYAFDPNYVLGVQNVQAGAPVVILQQSTVTNPALILWDINMFNQYITLVASQASPTPLVLTAPSPNAETRLVINNRQSSNNLQKWTFFGSQSFISSVGAPGMVVDDQNRGLQNGNPVWLYPNNGSPAQQWILFSATLRALEEDLAELESA
ncbi:RICIN domain-containing protein [Sphingomonas elodea]|uniref:RICIN domain-containing protein n=1 Tax=Sphingomonas elodea TaxID=179878 RepID=UPI0002630530|nr:RICIN domain-containing protein [Sphingomonas elodea]